MRRGQQGLSMIELMIAMVLGLLVSGGIVSVFIGMSSQSQAQRQLARLQEEGRFALGRLAGDIAQAGAQYCSNSGDAAKPQPNGLMLDHARAPLVYTRQLNTLVADLTTPLGSGNYPAPGSTPFALPAAFTMRGYDCDLSQCAPIDPRSAGATAIPAMGKAIGQRVMGSAVLTLRYLDTGKGWAVQGGTQVRHPPGQPGLIDAIDIVPAAGEPSLAELDGIDTALLADCAGAALFAVNASGNRLIPNGSNLRTPATRQPATAARVFNANRHLLTVSYYLAVVSNGRGGTTGALMRQVNSHAPGYRGPEELVRGVERLDFRYGVEDAQGNVGYLAANDVDAGTACPPGPRDPLLDGAGHEPGCLWRAVKSIQASLLLSGQQPLPSLSADERRYSYEPDRLAGAPSITPQQQGFEEALLRREFVAAIAVRNANP